MIEPTPVTESVYNLVGIRRGVAKVGHKWGNFGLCCCGWQTVGSAPDEKSFYGVANRPDGCIMVPFSRSKRKFRFKHAHVPFGHCAAFLKSPILSFCCKESSSCISYRS